MSTPPNDVKTLLWTARSPATGETVECRLHEDGGKVRLAVNGLGSPLVWEYGDRPKLEAQAGRLRAELARRGWLFV
jgi:hypothetical protein